MGLKEEQEEYLLKRIGDAVHDAEKIMNNSERLDSSFTTITTLLDHLSLQQNEILELVKSRKEQQVNQAPKDDVELL